MSELDERVEIQVRQLVGSIMREWGDPRVAQNRKPRMDLLGLLAACAAIIAVGMAVALALLPIALVIRLASGH